MSGVQPARYLRNPDVVLREEGFHVGGLLLNPDIHQVKRLNPTGLFIWQQCNARTLEEIAAALVATFEGASLNAVRQDAQEFIDELLATGFIGTVEAL